MCLGAFLCCWVLLSYAAFPTLLSYAAGCFPTQCVWVLSYKRWLLLGAVFEKVHVHAQQTAYHRVGLSVLGKGAVARAEGVLCCSGPSMLMVGTRPHVVCYKFGVWFVVCATYVRSRLAYACRQMWCWRTSRCYTSRVCTCEVTSPLMQRSRVLPLCTPYKT